MTDLMGQADMKWLIQSLHAHSGCETLGPQPKFSPPVTQKSECGDGFG